MESDSENNLGEGKQKSEIRTPKKAQHPFAKKVKPLAPGEQLNKVKELLEDTRARPSASKGEGQAVVLARLESFGDSLQGKISLDQALDILANQMAAETSFYDLTAQQVITRPDGATRQKALELYFHYLLGKPVERKIIENHNVDSLDDLKGKLSQSPALCETLAKMLEEAKGKQK